MNETRDASRQKSRERRKRHWEAFAQKKEHWHGWGTAYHRRLEEIYGFLVNPGAKILEIGCGEGNLLAALRPAVGVGVDLIWLAVGRPAGMPQPQCLAGNGLVENPLQYGYSAAGLFDFDDAVAHQGHSRRVVAPVFETFQSLD